MSNASLLAEAEVVPLGHDLSWDNIGGIALGWAMFLILEPLDLLRNCSAELEMLPDDVHLLPKLPDLWEHQCVLELLDLVHHG